MFTFFCLFVCFALRLLGGGGECKGTEGKWSKQRSRKNSNLHSHAYICRPIVFPVSQNIKNTIHCPCVKASCANKIHQENVYNCCPCILPFSYTRFWWETEERERGTAKQHDEKICKAICRGIWKSGFCKTTILIQKISEKLKPDFPKAFPYFTFFAWKSKIKKKTLLQKKQFF